MTQKKTILFLTTANLSMKPRLVKEIQLAQEIGYKVDLFAFKINNWTDENHDKLVKNLNIHCTSIYATKQNFIIWFCASILHLIILKTWRFNRKNLMLSAFASNKRSIMLYLSLWLKKKRKYDIIIGRNTTSIYPLLYAAKKFDAKIGFDVEDYHPGENVSWTNPEFEKERRFLLMQEVFLHSSYLSFAGTPIMQKVSKEFKIPQAKSNLLNLPNSFPSDEFPYPETTDDYKNKIQLVWFSMDVSSKRGLEELIEALKELKEFFQLTIYGTKIQSFYEQWIEPNLSFITLESPVTQIVLHKNLRKYDIGLALEMAKTDLNKQLAISNKLYAYLQSGLYSLTTNTTGHECLMQNYPDHGLICGQTPEEINKALLKLKENIAVIRKNKLERYKNAQELAWDNKRESLKQIWTELSTKNIRNQ